MKNIFAIDPSQLPTGATVKTGFTADGDEIPLSVTYNTESGKKATVEMVWTPDGDRIPATGFTIDGDFNFPNKKWEF